MAKAVGAQGTEISEAWIEEYEALVQMGCSYWEIIRAFGLREDAFKKRMERMRRAKAVRQSCPDLSATQLPNTSQSGVNW